MTNNSASSAPASESTVNVASSTTSSAVSSCAAATASSALSSSFSAADKPGMSLIWSDEFNINGLPDPNKWAYDTERNRWGWYNNEKQYYAANRLENARIEDGRLLITARKERLNAAPDFGGQNYTSARLLTRGLASWTYGFFEIRAKMPCGAGTWPAIWTLGVGGANGMVWPDDGEIDIMEFVGSDPTHVSATVHNAKYNWRGGIPPTTLKALVPDACTAFHNYQLSWTADKIAIGVDDRIYFEYAKPQDNDPRAWPFDRPQYLLLNIAVGGDLGGAVDDTIFPAVMSVEHVRIYKFNKP